MSKGRTQDKTGKISCGQPAVVAPNQILYFDIIIAKRTPQHENFKYILSSLDSYSRKLWLFPLRSKSAEEIAQNLTKLFRFLVRNIQR
jgi:hypothetical protein